MPKKLTKDQQLSALKKRVAFLPNTMPKKVTPKKEVILQQCLRDIDQCAHKIADIRLKADCSQRYERVEIGLNLIVARSLYKVEHSQRSPNGKKGNNVQYAAQNLTNSTSEDYETPISFEHFLETISWLPRRTAYCYIKAAENLGLEAYAKTEAKRAEAMQELRQSKALHKLDAKGWSELCGNGKKEKQVTVEPQNAFSFYKQSLNNIKQVGKTLDAIRGDLDPVKYATAAAVLQRELEKLTGQNWEPNAAAHDPHHYKSLWPDADEEQL